MKKIELNNKGTILALSIAIAVLLWSYVMGDINPQINRNFAGVAVNLVHSEDDELVLTSEIDPRVDVKISGRRNDVYEIRRSDMNFTLDLTNYGEGTHKIEIDHELNIGTANVKLDYSPKEVEVRLEKIVEKNLPVEMDIVGRLTGEITEERIKLRSKEVKVRGPRSLVESVSRLKVTLNTDEIVGKNKVELEIIPVDSNGEVVAGVELSEKTAFVDIVEKDINLVTVEPNIVGELLEGYELVSVEAKPATVELVGDTPLNSIKTEEIDISGVSESKKVEVELLLPDGVEILNEGSISVDISIKALEDETEDPEESEDEVKEDSKIVPYSISELSILNLRDGFNIGNKDELIDDLEVTIKGEKATLDDFKPSDLTLGIDFSSITEAGSYQVEVSLITVKEGITVESISPREITILVEEKE